MSENTSTKPGEWLTEQQLADHLHVSVRHMANLRKRGLPFVQLGSSVRYKLAEIEDYLCGNRRLSSHVERKRRQANLAPNLGGLLS
ncbi:MAG: helix-turn-helix domain-containing protein [Verrucomicrobiae bacterium]